MLLHIISIYFTILSIGDTVMSETDHSSCQENEYHFPNHEFVQMERTNNVTYDKFLRNLNTAKEKVLGNFTTLVDGQIPPPPGSQFHIHDKYGYLQLVTRVGRITNLHCMDL